MKRWPLHKAYFWEVAPFFRLLLPLAVGILCYEKGWLPLLNGWSAFVTAAIAFALFVAVFLINKSGGLYRAATFCLLSIMLLATGYSSSWYNDVRNHARWFGNSITGNSTYLARVNGAPVEKDRSWKVPVTIVSAIKDRKVTALEGEAFLYLYKDHLPMQLQKGDTLFVPGKWQPIKNAGNPFEFNYAQYCRQNGLHYQQSCSAKDIRLYATNDEAAAPIIDRTHNWCMAQLARYIADPKTKGLLQAMLLGDEVNLDEDLRQSYADTGIIHIIAISGGNVTIFFIVISFLLWWLKDRKHLWVRYAIAFPLVWFYVVMAGAPPSAIRAAIMFSILAVSVMLNKNNNSLNTLFTAAFILLFVQPMWLFSLGFQLSFVAVLSIILFYKPIYRWFTPKRWVTRKLWEVVVASIAAEILVAPLVIYYFHTFPLLFIVANVTAYIFMTIVLIASMLVIVLCCIPIVATCIGIITVCLVTMFDRFVVWLQALNPTSFHFLMITAVELLLVYIIIAGITTFLINKEKRGLATGLATAVLLLLSFCHSEWARLHQHRLVVYNAGKANHIDQIMGGRFTVISTDTANSKKISYAVKPAHINWRAWQQDSTAERELFSIGDKTVLILNRDMITDDHFPVDYLVINYTGKPDLQQLQKTFTPSAIIVGNNYSSREQEKLASEFRNKGVNIYSIAERGAFVLN